MSRTILAMGAALLMLGGCGGSDDEDITIEVTFDGFVSCFEAGVDTVTIDWANDALPSLAVPCDSAGGVAFFYEDVPFGTYIATVTGFFQGEAFYAGRGAIEVDPALPNVYSFDAPPAL